MTEDGSRYHLGDEPNRLESTSFLLGWLIKLGKILVLDAKFLLRLRMSPELVTAFYKPYRR